jgi:molybdopterin converting factor small subunit
MPVIVELFGIPRARAGIAQTTAVGECLGDVLVDLAARFPALAQTCFEGRSLRAEFIANLSGQRFVTAPETPLCDGETVLLLSLDAGG